VLDSWCEPTHDLSRAEHADACAFPEERNAAIAPVLPRNRLVVLDGALERLRESLLKGDILAPLDQCERLLSMDWSERLRPCQALPNGAREAPCERLELALATVHLTAVVLDVEGQVLCAARDQDRLMARLSSQAELVEHVCVSPCAHGDDCVGGINRLANLIEDDT